MKLFKIEVENIIDIITNSSSELFVLEGNLLSTVKEMVSEIYPNYRNEYEEITSLKDASLENISVYVCYIAHPERWNWGRLNDTEIRKLKIQEHFELAAKYNMEASEFYDDLELSLSRKYLHFDISEKALRKIAETLDPNGTIFLLFSLGDNPGWDMQERLSTIGDRYHLG